MAEIKVRIAVSDPAGVIAVYDQIQVHRSTTGKSGPYNEITTPIPPASADARLTLVAGKTTYCFTDQCGDFSYFYKTRFFNSVTLVVSQFSEPIQGDADSALDVISVEDLQTNFLFGVDLTDDAGQPYPDSLFEFYIKSSVSYLEQALDLPIRPTRYVEEHDYVAEDFRQSMAFFLDHYPVVSVDEVKLMLPGGGGEVLDPAWFKLQKEFGHLNLIPGLGGANVPSLGVSGAYHPFYRNSRFLPNVFAIKYTAGFLGGCEGGRGVPDNIKELAGKIASYGPLNIAGDLVAGAGVASTSLSIDGLSQGITTTNSSTNAGYGARLLQYRKEVKEQIPVIRNYYKGARLHVA
jgi:hypothetical protein